MDSREHSVEPVHSGGFEFDCDHNIIRSRGFKIRLSPHEAGILQVLLRNRARAVPIGSLIQQVYGSSTPENASVSIRVSVHSLRKKLCDTGISIKAKARVGYEVDTDMVPELNNRLSDKILVALNMAKALGECDIAEQLQVAYDKVEAGRREWLASPKRLLSKETEQPHLSCKAVA
jgi:DNA-binding winged helix-turn-helix (wHTH) protein